MQTTHQRRQQRVAYAASVRVHPPGRHRPFEGRTINLSRSGVLIESLQPCAVGTEVVCDIALPGGRRQLPGRVTRLQALTPAAVALGIEFTTLSAPDAELLSEAVGEDDGRARMVQVRFEGMREPMRSRALLTDDGIRLTTALPFLRLRTGVEVTFLSGKSQVQSQGVIRDVELDQMGPDGIPRLAVNVRLAGDAEAEDSAVTPIPFAKTPGLVSPAAFAATPPPTSGTPTPVAARSPANDSPTERRRRSAAPVGRIAAVAAGTVVVALGLLAYQRLPPAIVQLESHPLVEPPRPAPPPDPVAAAPAPATPPPAPVVEEKKRPVQVIPAPLPEGTPGPSVETEGEETTALVPLTGSTAGMFHYSLAHPRGLLVNLPQAQSAIPLGLHAVGRDGLQFVWVRERREGGLQVRFIFTRPPPDERLLEVEEDGLRIRVRRHASPVAQDTPPQTP